MELVPLDRLHTWDKNPRLIKDKRFENLCKSIQDDPEFMDIRPVLATLDGTIYAGNMRYRAAKYLGWKDIPAIITDIPKKLATERALKDNNTFGEWDDTLSTVIDELEKDGVDISTLGLDEHIDDILGDDVEEPEEQKSRKPVTCPECQATFTP